jgi:hypothetical protein
LGTKLYEEALLHLGGRPILVEVEAVGPAGPDLEDRERRVAFYRRLGCRRVEGLNYMLPLVAEGTPPPLNLFVGGFKGPTVRSTSLREWLTDIYVGAYDCPANDRRLDLMLGGLGERLTLS